MNARRVLDLSALTAFSSSSARVLTLFSSSVLIQACNAGLLPRLHQKNPARFPFNGPLRWVGSKAITFCPTSSPDFTSGASKAPKGSAAAISPTTADILKPIIRFSLRSEEHTSELQSLAHLAC